MKHIFHIHSNTCYLVSLGIVDKKRLNVGDVIFLICRNLPKIVDEIHHLYIDNTLYYFPYFTNSHLFSFQFLYSQRAIRKVDYIINESVDEEYVYYVHNSRHYLNSIIVSHPLCQQVEFMEDGLDAYFDSEHFGKKYSYTLWKRHRIVNFILGKLLGDSVYSRLKQYNDPFKNKGGIKSFYGLTDAAFSRLLDDKSQYYNVSDIKKFSIPTIMLPEHSHLYLFSALVEQNIASNDEIEMFLEHFVVKYDIHELYISFHPHQSQLTRQMIETKLSSLSIDYKIIPDDIMVEKLLLNNSGINIYGIGTSLLIYAAYFSSKNNVFALSKYFSQIIDRETDRTKYWLNTFSNIKTDNFHLI
jgi:hypothetical protein